MSIDVLRGFAVLGILVMNIQSFSMIGPAYLNPTAYGDLTGTNHTVWLLSHVLADRKFMTIFSMLFGAGIVLMSSRREAAGADRAGAHYRRMGLLLLVGLLHGHLLWYGDILHAYALCGMVAYLFRRGRPGTLIAVGLASISVASALSLLFQWFLNHSPAEAVEKGVVWWTPGEADVASEIAALRGGWFEQLPHRTMTALFFQTALFAIEVSWRSGGLMLVGMGLFKLGVFSAKRSYAMYVTMAVIGFSVGIPIILYGVHRNFAAEWSFRSCFCLGAQFNYWASLLVAMGWVGLVMLVCKHSIAPKLIRTLAAVGQMAFTNYLLQTVICTTIFYGHGFGLFGQVERLGQILIVLAVWIVLLVLSPLWLRHFRFGPAEWLWRSLTYMSAPPMRRQE
ncbi:MAG: DUF418 domain-containing protein [Phycisphaerales bacterium]|nr:MAG: DUF418 domain-containing protein [Phycisphaerales bacterium]